MKKSLVLAAAVALGVTFAAEAQTLSVGPRIGATFAKLSYSGDDADDYNDLMESKAGLQLGAVANLMVNDLFSVQPELLYVSKGTKIEEGSNSLKQKMSYLELPILAKVSFGTEQVQGFVTGGPTIGYWLSGKSKYDLDGDEETEDYDFEDEDKRAELGASFGVGVAYKVGAGAVNLDIRYGFGLSSIYDSTDDDNKIKNRVLGVSLAYLFGL